jgi:hypothetical protein
MTLKDYGPEGPLGFPLLDRQARALEQIIKGLPGGLAGKDYAYTHTVIAKAPTELNPGERSDVSWISTESLDRIQDVVLAKGLNDSQFTQNPIVTLGHSYFTPPVGRSLWRKRVRDGELLGVKAKTRYPERPDNWPADAGPWAPDKVFSMIQAGLLQGKSIGFLPTKVHYVDQRESQKTGWPEGVRVVEEWLLIEYACCYLPMNQDALVEAVSKGLEIPDSMLKALGVELPPPPKSDPPPLVVPTSPSFTTLDECHKAVMLALGKIDLNALVEKCVESVYHRLRGKV